MINEPPTTSNTTSSDLGTNNKRYPCPLWLRVLREIFLHWWLIPLTCLIIYILIVAFNLYIRSDIYHALLLPFFTAYWWIVIPALAIAITLLFRAYTWADADESREYRVQREQQRREFEQRQREREQRQRELEQQPPPSGFKLQHTLRGHTREIRQIAWSPDGRVLASGSNDQSVRVWDGATGQALHTLTGHTSLVNSVAWSPDGRLLASSSYDRTVRLWDGATGRQICSLEGHTAAIGGISFSADSRILASKSRDGTLRLWKVDTWEEITSLYESSSNEISLGVAFHPRLPVLATLGEQDTVIRIWHLDFDVILGKAPDTSQAHYTNARVVLVGDSGVGKSGLGLVLSKQPFALTESTHARRVWTFDSRQVELDGERKETRETLLWDLAGQPGYRLIHQLHLNEVSVALVVFDGRSETDPFAGVQHWGRALRIAQQAQGSSALPLKKFLVAARMDRGGIGVSRSRIDALVREMGFAGYCETSAKEGFGIEQLQLAIAEAIDWASLPRVSSTVLFQSIKDFLGTQKKAGRLLSTVDDLYHTFLKGEAAPQETEILRAQFETCIGRVESSGLIRRLSFGNFVLLQPELLDSYASALVNAVKDEPDGLGSIAEEKVQAGVFAMSADERINNKEQEKLLLIAMIEDLLRNEIALRENSEDGIQLVFPSQSTRENAQLPDPEEKTAVFSFEGPVLNIYATLCVRLSHSGLLRKKELWRNAITYEASVGGACGMFLNNRGEGSGELALFFDKAASPQTRIQFEDYVHIHLRRRALPTTIKRRRVFVCSDCGNAITDQQVRLRRERSFNWMDCSVCGTYISLLDREEQLTAAPSPAVQAMDRTADLQRDREAAKSVVAGKIKTQDFDVFLCYNAPDKAAVKQVAEQLKEQGILSWLDEWELRPGMPRLSGVEEQIGKFKSAAVFVGKNDRGPWQDMEIQALLRKFVNREQRCPVIPVILSDCVNAPKLPLFLENMTWVDFRQRGPDPMTNLIWGITGKRPWR